MIDIIISNFLQYKTQKDGGPRDTRDSQVSQAGPKFKAVPKRANERIIREFLRRYGYFKKVK